MAPPEDIPAMRERIFEAALAIDRDPRDITLVYNLEFRLDNDVEVPPHVVSGPASQVADQLRGFASLGFSALNLKPAGPEPEVQIERLAREVLPSVRSGG
jgi:hypothetical protein